MSRSYENAGNTYRPHGAAEWRKYRAEQAAARKAIADQLEQMRQAAEAAVIDEWLNDDPRTPEQIEADENSAEWQKMVGGMRLG